ncbi:16S rRNA (guanine(966)-N(2))-methyltransferase RsmD [Sporolactobacillus vineae]|uniref:16S rRNA (guanine(966)-N(2))-methyltransferase RsmD n=1 Tax=Sporolactobacillus vineae TaxID=444463 RepID=UPI00028A06E0|nr:16S rRNA (guanine(966)-N(2))-methyltransferase RsmD [Sporolactobacillus vineae]
MRVIAGKNKGRQLKAVPGRLTRPTTDKVKETIFNMIGPYLSGGRVLDLYGGSGGLGLEALSRGANEAVFVDRAAQACHVIAENADKCGYTDRCRILHLNSEKALSLLAESREVYDYVFLDPPYAKQHLNQDIDFLTRKRMLAPNAVVIAEHEDTVVLPDRTGSGLIRTKYRTYQGKTAVSVYCMTPEDRGDGQP